MQTRASLGIYFQKCWYIGKFRKFSNIRDSRKSWYVNVVRMWPSINWWHETFYLHSLSLSLYLLSLGAWYMCHNLLQTMSWSLNGAPFRSKNQTNMIIKTKCSTTENFIPLMVFSIFGYFVHTQTLTFLLSVKSNNNNMSNSTEIASLASIYWPNRWEYVYIVNK